MKFDPQQQAVISHVQGNALVLAGAGSGKTTAITERTIKLIESGVRPSSIIMMTFTNKSARDMRGRIYTRLSAMGIDPQALPVVSTFHSFGQRIITKNAEACGREGMPSLMSADDQDSLLTLSFKKHCTDFALKVGIDFYDKIRNNGLSAGHPSDQKALIRQLTSLCQDFPSGIAWEPFLASMIDYEKEKKQQNVLDYHDLIILPIHAFQSDSHLRDKIRKLVKYLVIDEAQDTNIAQAVFIREMAPPGGDQSVLLVGDPRQSIHRWRGANPENLTLFQSEYSAQVLYIQNNYRSLPDIVNRANKVIGHNFDTLEKDGIPTRAVAHDPVSYIKSTDSSEMTSTIAKQIKAIIDSGVSPGDIAILYRTNRLANLLEPDLLVNNIPYKIYNGQDLLSRTESKILLAAIRFAINPRDLMAFRRLTELMPRVGAKLIEKLIADTHPRETIYDAAGRLPESSQAAVFPMLKSIIELRNNGPMELLQWMGRQPEIRPWIVKRAHAYLKVSKCVKPKEFDVWKKYNRKETLSDDDRNLLRGNKVVDRCEKYQVRLNEAITLSTDRMRLVCKTILDRCKQLPESAAIAEHWFEANNVIAAPPDEENKIPSVHLMTLHSSKGLEFDHVFLPWASDGILPFTRSNDSADDPEQMKDERRLAYVGITRGKNGVYFHGCDRGNLMDGKGTRYFSPSPFIKEAELLTDEEKKTIKSDGNGDVSYWLSLR